MSPSEFFESVYSAFQCAARSAGGEIERDYAIGGYTVRLRFAGAALVPVLAAAFDHLAANPPPSAAGLTICLWDSASTGVSMPARPWPADACTTLGEVRGFNDARFHTALYADVGSLSMLDSASGRALWWTRDPSLVPFYERAAPLRFILHWWLRERGRVLLHAGAIGSARGGALLVGKAGSGKSTTALACLVGGLQYAGDDRVLLALDGEPRAYSLYNIARLDAAHLKKFPALAAHAKLDELAQQKALLYLHRHCAGSLSAELPLRAILLPRVTGRSDTALRAASPAAALQALAPSSLLQLPGAGRVELQAMADLVRRLPCYWLDLGTDLPQIPAVISEVLAG